MEEVTIISAIIMRIAKSAIALGEKIEGPELKWLSEQLDRAAASARAAGDRPDHGTAGS
jgi:hypothetical protein